MIRSKIRQLTVILFLSILLGCGITPKKVDVKTILMPKKMVMKRNPGALWSGENSRNRLFADFRARDVGDIITVMIVEKTEARKEAATSTSKDSSMDTSVTGMLGMPLDLGMTDFMGLGNTFSPSVKSGHADSLSGKGSTERKGEITATITTRVTDVLANGNLFIEGKKETTVNKEKQHVVLSGVVRTEDISSANTISSDSIADLRIELSGYGVLSAKQGSGWMTKVLDRVWPF